MSELKDITGQRFGKRVVIARADRPGDQSAHWLVRCDCGTESVIKGRDLRAGQSRQCKSCRAVEHRVEVPGYTAAHDRVRRLRGRPEAHACVTCGEPAQEWALRADAAERHAGIAGISVLEYSANPADYQPMCVRHHRLYDAEQRNGIDE